MIEFVKLIFLTFFKVLACHPHGLGWAGRNLTRIEMNQISPSHLGPQLEWPSLKWVGLARLPVLTVSRNSVFLGHNTSSRAVI